MRFLILTIAVLLPTLANAYTDEQLAMAIYHAEGGAAAQYPFGIRSVYCGSFNDCKKCCKTTIKHNRIRFAKNVHRGSQTYIEYLGSVYCPIKGRALSSAERRLNRYWVRNVSYWLARLSHDKNQA